MTAPLIPNAGFAIVRPTAVDDMTEGGIYIPDLAKGKPYQGTVLAFTPGPQDRPDAFAVGCTALYNKYSGKPFEDGGDDLLAMRASEIYATSERHTDEETGKAIETLTPAGARVLVLYDNAEAFVANGLILVPEAYRKQPLQGTVVAVGPGTPQEDVELAVGESVAFDWCHGTQVMHDGKVHLVIFQDDILGRVEDGAKTGTP